MEHEEYRTFEAAPSAGRRPAWEVAALFAVILLLVFLSWRLQNPPGNTRQRAAALAGDGDRFARMALSRSGNGAYKKSPFWTTAKKQYTRALEVYPRLPRARRALAAMEYLNNDPASAKRLMQGPAEIAPPNAAAWRAFRVAFGAETAPRAEYPRLREALQRNELGWSRHAALLALADTKEDEMRWNRALRGKSDRLSASEVVLVLMILAGFPLLLVGLVLLWRVLRDPPPGRLAPLHVPAGALIALAAVGLVLLSAPAGLLALLANGGLKGTIAPREALLISTLGSALGLALALAATHAFFASRGGSLAALGWRTRGALPWALFTYVGMLPLLLAAFALGQAVLNLFPNAITPDNPAGAMAAAARGWEVLALFALTVLVAPAAEELVMRGLLFRGLARRYGDVVGAVASSLIFAGLHPQLPAGFPPIFVIGLGLCWVYRSSGTLTAAILVHAINNGVVLAAALLTVS